MFGGVYTVLSETTRNPTNTMVKPLDSNELSCKYLRVVYALVDNELSPHVVPAVEGVLFCPNLPFYLCM